MEGWRPNGLRRELGRTNVGRRRGWAIGVALAFLLLWSALAHGRVGSWNDASRLATAEALVHHSTWAIDETALGEHTQDRVYLNGHFYSSKPPVLSLLISGIYALLHQGLGLSLNPELCKAESDPCYCLALLCPEQTDWAYYGITVTVVGLSSALLLAVFYLVTIMLGRSTPLALILTGLLGLGTLVFPYSLVLNNHIPAAACLMVGFYALLRSQENDLATSRWLWVAGLMTALAFTFDLGTVFFLCCFAGYALLRHRLQAWPFVVGNLLPLVLLVALDWWSMGDPLPPNMHPAGYDYPESPFVTAPAGTARTDNVLRHTFRMLLGDHGLFAFSPVLLWAAIGLAKLWGCRAGFHTRIGLAVALGLAIALTVLAYAVLTDHFGGTAYGVRWFVPLTPLLFLFAAQPALYRSILSRMLFAVAALLSLVGGWRGALHPWKPARPPLRLEYATPAVGRYVGSLPEDAVVYTTPPRIHQLPLFPRPTWRRRLREYLSTDDTLPAGVPDRPVVYVLNQHDASAAELLEATFPQGKWALIADGLAVYYVSSKENRPSPQTVLQAGFAEQIDLIGADLSTTSVHPGDVLTVWLYWVTRPAQDGSAESPRSVGAPMDVGYTAFVHLLGPTNPATGTPLWAQDDHPPGYPFYLTDRWFPGEVVLGRFRFQVPSDAPPGEYTLTTGLYDPASLQRLPRSDIQVLRPERGPTRTFEPLPDAERDTATITTVTVGP